MVRTSQAREIDRDVLHCPGVNLVLEVLGPLGDQLSLNRRKVFGHEGGSIGRAKECDWVLPSPYISRFHARVVFAGGTFLLHSDSSSGVSINARGNVIPSGEGRAVRSGDRIFLEEFEIGVNVTGDEDAPLVGSPAGRGPAGEIWVVCEPRDEANTAEAVVLTLLRAAPDQPGTRPTVRQLTIDEFAQQLPRSGTVAGDPQVVFVWPDIGRLSESRANEWTAVTWEVPSTLRQLYVTSTTPATQPWAAPARTDLNIDTRSPSWWTEVSARTVGSVPQPLSPRLEATTMGRITLTPHEYTLVAKAVDAVQKSGSPDAYSQALASWWEPELLRGLRARFEPTDLGGRAASESLDRPVPASAAPVELDSSASEPMTLERREALNRMVSDSISLCAPEPGQPIDMTVFGPRSAERRSTFFIQAVIHPPGTDEEALRNARLQEPGAVIAQRLRVASPVQQGSKLTVRLHSEARVRIDEPIQSASWSGILTNIQFAVRLPWMSVRRDYVFTVELAVNDIPVGRCKVRVAAGSAAPDQAPVKSALGRYERAFLSYASEDLRTVADIAQLCELQGLKIFFDRTSLRAGTEWGKELREAIIQSDLFILCWSKGAAKSPNVRQEIEWALETQNISSSREPDIRPFLLDGPPIAEPPRELRHLHFGSAARLAKSVGTNERAP